MPGIRTLHWGHVIPASVIPGFDPCATAVALWPAPVNADACFAAAGFHDFNDPDDLWDAQWRDLIARTLRELQTHGPLTIIEEAQLYEPDPTAPLLRRTAARLLSHPGPRRQVHLPVQEQTFAATTIADHTEVFLHFGSPAKACLRAGSGHELLWIGWTQSQPDPATSVIRIADDLAIAPMTLDWPRLCGHPHRKT